MLFAVHTNKGKIIIEAKTPNDARKIALAKNPDVIITKVKRAA